ncbi:MAG TPA: acyl-CoA dehydrogenase C-terminal domain-containing protein, partial [Sphingomonas sp.]|nr:acyl-CoA dehydrogenase C-terminal domain-containing protein [Sphingomonas sp.]
KLGLDGGAAFDLLIDDICAETADPRIVALADAVEVAAATFRQAAPDDRLAASYPFLTMLSVAVCGWLMEKQGRIAAEGDTPFLKIKAAACRFYVEQIVPEAFGLKAAATAKADVLYAVDAETLAA